MAEDVTCPTCGGIIFSDDADAMALTPCTCGAPTPAEAASVSVERGTSSSLTSISFGEEEEESANPFASVPAARPSADSAESRKQCCNCGKDVTGRKRLKDSEGRYWCPDCGKKDEKQKRVARKREEAVKSVCGMCGKDVAVQNLLNYDNRFICQSCYKEQKELEKKTEARIGRINNAFKGQDWKRLTPMLVIMGICLLIIILKKLHIIGG